MVFEDNDESLWSEIRNEIGSFLTRLFADGILNIVVGFAPLRPAEFIIIKIAQLAGQRRA